MKSLFYLRLLSILAVCSVTGSSMLACSGDSPEKPALTTESLSAAPVSETETTASETKPQIPEKDMNGVTFTILTEDWVGYTPLDITDIYAEETTGEPLNDAAFLRLESVQSAYNCVISWADLGTDLGYRSIRKTVTAGDDTYQLALIRSRQFSSLLTGHMLTDLDTLPYLDSNMPWYDKNSTEALGLCNRNYGIVSDLSTNSYKLIFCAYFNQDMAEEYKLGDIYQLVDNGKWTWDQMYTLGKTVAADVNNDGDYTTDDRYGFTYIVDVPEGLLNASGVRYASLNEDGIPEITYAEEKNIDKMQYLLELLSDKTVSMNMHMRSTNTARDEVGLFINRQTLFSLAGIYYAEQFRDMKNHFGIIPLPKYDESGDYASPLFCDVFPITIVPASCQNLEDTSIILEAMAYEGQQKLLPALYDTILQGKVVRDETSSRMLDIIFENTFYDSGILFQFGGIVGAVRGIYSNLNGNFVSTFEKYEKRVEKDIDKLITSLRES